MSLFLNPVLKLYIMDVVHQYRYPFGFLTFLNQMETKILNLFNLKVMLQAPGGMFISVYPIHLVRCLPIQHLNFGMAVTGALVMDNIVALVGREVNLVKTYLWILFCRELIQDNLIFQLMRVAILLLIIQEIMHPDQ